MRRIWTIAWKDIYITFSDRSLVLTMIATPLVIATIVGLSFGKLSSGDVSIQHIPIAVVNLDQGFNAQNLGETFVEVLTLPAGKGSPVISPQSSCSRTNQEPVSADLTTLHDLTDAHLLTNADTARAGVDNGHYTAAVIIPLDFSHNVISGTGNSTQIEVYANAGQALPSAIIRSIVENIVNQIETGTVAARATLETVQETDGPLQMAAMAADTRFAQAVACAMTPTLNDLRIDQQTVAGQPSNSVAALLVTFGSAQAMFFALFTGQQGALSVFEERRHGTLQRLIVSPTPRLHILVGKLLGTFLQCLFQLMLLALALTLVGSLLSGRLLLIWGANLPGVLLVMMMAAAAVTGLGTFLAGIARTPEQSTTFAQVLNLSLGLLGGGFGLQLPEPLARLSMIYWGSDAFRKLAAGQGNIMPDLLVLLAHGVLLFAVGWWLFQRRLDI